MRDDMLMAGNITFSTIECCECGVVFAVDSRTHKRYRDTGKSFYCPNGHGQRYTKSRIDVLEERIEEERRNRQRAEQNLAMWQDAERDARRLAESEARRAAAYKGVATKTRNRIKRGVCPCCNRHFENLRRHMETQHPDMPVDPVAA